MTSGRDDERTDEAADRALLGMARIVVPAEPTTRAEARREKLVPRLSAFTDDVFTRAPRRSRHARIAIGAAAILAASVSVFAWHSWRSGSVVASDAEGTAMVRASGGTVRVRHAGSPTDALGPLPRSLGALDRIETGEGRADVNLASGAVVALGGETALELGAVERAAGAVSERVELVAGTISVKVPKLSAGSRFVVGTPDSTVTVHGTAFVVEVQPATGATGAFTTVSVTEGRVSVKREGREVFLGPGATWSSAARPASATDVDRAPSPASGDVVPTEAVGAAKPTIPSPARSSTLPQENLLLRSAMTARRGGDPKRALDLIARLLSTYPDSPLGPEARVERDRAFADLRASSAP